MLRELTLSVFPFLMAVPCVTTQVVTESRTASAPAPLAPCTAPPECLARVRAGIAHMMDPQSVEATGGDMQKLGRDVADLLLDMGKKFPDAPETLQARIAFLSSGAIGFFRSESMQFLEAMPVDRLSIEDLRKVGDAAVLLNRKEIDEKVLTAWMAKEPDLAHRIELWFYLSNQPTMTFRKDTLRTVIATTAKGKDELAVVALKNAEWDLRFGSRRSEDYERMLGGTVQNYPGTPAAELAAARLRARALKAGDELPAFSVTDLAGQPVSPKDLQGQPAVLWFWASWQPGFAAMAEALRNAKVHVLAVSIDAGGEALKPLVEQHKVPGRIVDGTGGPGRDLAERFDALRTGVRDCRLLVLDAQGRVVSARVDADNLAAALDQARAGAAPPRTVRRR